MKQKIVYCLITCLLFTLIPMNGLCGYETDSGNNPEFVVAKDQNTPDSIDILSPEELALIDAMKDFLYDQVDMDKRILSTNILADAVAALAFDVGFNSDSVIYGLIESIISSGADDEQTQQIKEWYNNLENTSILSMAAYDIPTAQDIELFAQYIDNNSNKTIFLHHGYRTAVDEVYPQAKYFSENGYNVLIPEVRSHDNSGGKYISFGYYESEDLNNWVNMELEKNPDQELILYGVSMGAATTLMAQEDTASNVTSVIEDCSYATLDQQLRDILQIITGYLQYIPGFHLIDWDAIESDLIHRLNNNHVKPVIKMDITDVSPLNSVADTEIPKLFFHGDADTFIKPVALELLYDNALGYKEYQYIAGAGHGASFRTDPDTYTAKLEEFLANVSALE